MKIRELIPQTQPTSDTCVQTCIAMICGVPVDEILKKYSPCQEPIFWDSVQRILEDYGIRSIRYASLLLPDNRVFMISVPSLNLQGELHAMVVVTNDTGMHIYDPNSGRDVKCYVKDCNVRGYGDIIEVFPIEK